MLADPMDQNVRWANAKHCDGPEYFHRHSSLQRPDCLLFGCSDRRVPTCVGLSCSLAGFCPECLGGGILPCNASGN